MLNQKQKYLKEVSYWKSIVKILFRWNTKKFENEYLKKLERSWVKQKEKERQIPLEAEPQEKILSQYT